MRSGVAVLIVSVFLASAVESVEALTIVLAVGVTRGWRSALEGTAAALGVLAVLVAIFGPLLVHIPLRPLRLVIGGLLLLFGLQWLRKALLRAGGFKAKHDEDAIFAAEVAALERPTGPRSPVGDSDDRGPHAEGRPVGQRPNRRARDALGFSTAFKGVFLEGIEVVVLVLTLGASAHRVGTAALAALAAVAVVVGLGAIVSRQLSGVPENALKMAVGIMLVSLGTFWSGEGAGVHWPGSDLSIPVLVGFFVVTAWLLSVVLRRFDRVVAGAH